MKQAMLFLLTLVAFNLQTHAAIIGEEITYQSDGQTMQGYIAYDDQFKTKRPGVLVVHEWWGHNSYARKRADMLAELGYVGFAIDMYGDGKKTHHPKEAGAFSKAVKSNMPMAEKRFHAAQTLLSQHNMVEPKSIAAMGYCFGGGIVLEMARRGADLKGVASFHGSLKTSTPADKHTIKAKVLVANGASDPFVKAEDISNFHQEMKQANVSYQLFNYEGAKHSFTNPEADQFAQQFNMPLGYNKQADEQSWQALQRFLNEIF